jgi:hypothetical protein
MTDKDRKVFFCQCGKHDRQEIQAQWECDKCGQKHDSVNEAISCCDGTSAKPNTPSKASKPSKPSKQKAPGFRRASLASFSIRFLGARGEANLKITEGTERTEGEASC